MQRRNKMGFTIKKQKIKQQHSPTGNHTSGPAKFARTHPPVIQHYRNIGNMAAQRKKENEKGSKQQATSSPVMDFSNVKITTNSAQAAGLGAQAFTRDNNIHFAPGAYNPGTSAGKQLLGHELGHVVQQRQGRVQTTKTVGGLPVNDNPALEREADALGKQLV
ncbi:MAG: DUF4157 domain-containing protein [Candidatus Aminicenantes bacterium]|nr:DUF4157 domain-containing protein [Candidatus Aminicenantes bacterium]